MYFPSKWLHVQGFFTWTTQLIVSTAIFLGFMIILCMCVCAHIYIQVKQVMVIVDAVTSGLWGFMWFVAFVYSADQWRKADFKSNLSSSTVNCANSGVAFSFFSIFVWVRAGGMRSTSHKTSFNAYAVLCGIHVQCMRYQSVVRRFPYNTATCDGLTFRQSNTCTAYKHCLHTHTHVHTHLHTHSHTH